MFAVEFSKTFFDPAGVQAGIWMTWTGIQGIQFPDDEDRDVS